MGTGLLLTLLLWVSTTAAVEREKFKICSQSGFCTRQRAVKEPTGFEVVADSVKFNDTAFLANIKNKDTTLKMAIVALKDSTFRIQIDEDEGALYPRFQPVDALKEDPKQQKFKKTKTTVNDTKMTTDDGHRIVVTHNPLRIDFYAKDKLISSINSQGQLFFEKFKKKILLTDREKGFWEETFKDFKDTKPHGSSSVGVDITFVGPRFVFGIPEHAETYNLRDTLNYEPYRLYNLDVFQYELNTPMALYGSIPYLVGTTPKRTTGVLWLNAAETWVDVKHMTADKGKLALLVADADTRAKDVHQVNTRFMSESGLIDIFITLGPSPADSFRQLSTLTGTYPLPPEFSLGYHQSRWNYVDQKDVKDVHDNFEKHEIPLDVIWLDIEHTDKKKYFTWDQEKFPQPLEMIEELAEKGRKLVTIVDPHISKDVKYDVYKNAKAKKLFVKTNDKKNFEGNCWPGDSTYIDFFNPEAREFWANLFSLQKYNGTTTDVHIWNDMNEPSVFNGPEVTMPKDLIHYGDFEHRDVHNMYGFYHHQATFDGLKKRNNKELRPFVLTRAFFAGSQRTAAVWTGDNTADWGHLKASIPMLLTLGTAGIPHVGADVGGFFGDPDEELLVRWYQMGAFQPFFRGHSHQDTKRREPWLFNDTTTDAIREAIKTRYQFLPYWYTLFYEHTITGKPVMRPFWLEFQEDEGSYDEDRQFMVGNALLVKPIIEPKATQASIYLPGRREVWYEWNTHKARPSPGAVQIPANLKTIPMFQRGGTIIPVREEVKLTSKASREDPITLYIALNMKGDFANGTIYLDDGESYNYENGDFAYWGITFKRTHDYLHTITNKRLDSKGKLDSDIFIERIVIRGAKFYPRTAHIYRDDFTPDPLDFEYDRDNFFMEITSPTGYITNEFKIDFHS